MRIHTGIYTYKLGLLDFKFLRSLPFESIYISLISYFHHKAAVNRTQFMLML